MLWIQYIYRNEHVTFDLFDVVIGFFYLYNNSTIEIISVFFMFVRNIIFKSLVLFKYSVHTIVFYFIVIEVCQCVYLCFNYCSD